MNRTSGLVLEVKGGLKRVAGRRGSQRLPFKGGCEGHRISYPEVVPEPGE